MLPSKVYTLTEPEQKAKKELPAKMQEFVNAKLDFPIKVLSAANPAEFNNSVNRILTNAIDEFKLNITDIDYSVLLGKFKALLCEPANEMFTTREIDLFVKNGVRGDYGHNGQLTNISIRNLSIWIKSAAISRERLEAIKEYNRLVAQAEYQPKAPDMLFSLKACKNAFERYKQSGEIPPAGFAYYNIINEAMGKDYGNGQKSLISDPIVRKRIIEESQKEYTATLKMQKDREEKRGNHARAEDITSLMASMNKDENFKSMVKKKALKAFFDQLISDGKELDL